MRTDEKSVRRALEHAELSAASTGRLRDALEAVLLYHSSGSWDVAKRDRWVALTGSLEATTKVLCDVVRLALAESQETGQ